MKKGLVKLISMLVALLISIGAMGGCNLVTTDNDKDMDRVVATVNVTHEENITKRDLVMQYMNYGYNYVNYYGYTLEQTYTLMLNNYIETRIMVQYALSEFEKNPEKYGITVDESKTGIEKYLKADDIIEVKYNSYKAINDLIDSFVDHDHDEHKTDTIIGEVRTVPTNAAVNTFEPDLEAKIEYVDKYEKSSEAFEVKDTAERRKAYNSVIKLLENNSLLGDFGGDLRKTTYFNNLIKNNQESFIVTYFNNYLRKIVIDSLSYSDVSELFNQKRTTQVDMSDKEFVDALSNATITSPALVGKNGSFGYVYNILLGASTKQTDDIAKIKTDNPNISDEAYATARKNILDTTVIKDLRTTWIQSGYDFELIEEDGKVGKFTGDYTLVKDPDNSLAFQGTVDNVKDAEYDKDGFITEPAKYGVTSVTEFTLGEFIAMVKEYVGGEYTYKDYEMGDDVYDAATLDMTDVSEYDAKIEELLFAFSTDPGSLNKYKGYLIKPPVDGADSEQFVKTFGDAGRKLLDFGSGYVIVASDYGYHLMFYSEKVDSAFGYNTLDAYLDSLDIDKEEGTTWADYFMAQLADWDKFVETDNYLYYLANSLVSEKITEKTDSFTVSVINEYRYEKEGAVVISEKVFNSLIG